MSYGGHNKYYSREILNFADISGLSICKELALDEDEEEGKEEEKTDLTATSLLQAREVQTPVQLGNALMKALKVGGDDRAGPIPTRQQQPKNQDEKRNTNLHKILCIHVQCHVMLKIFTFSVLNLFYMYSPCRSCEHGQSTSECSDAG